MMRRHGNRIASPPLFKGIATFFFLSLLVKQNEARGCCATKDTTHVISVRMQIRRGSCSFKERLPSPSACVAMVSAPPSPPSPVHCAQPVAMVTGLSDGGSHLDMAS